MKGQQISTKYFGIYTEQKDTDNLPEELEGDVVVRSRNNLDAAFLFTTSGKACRYDLPSFMQNYKNCRVAVLGRKFTKTVGDKTYNKLVVISVKVLARP